MRKSLYRGLYRLEILDNSETVLQFTSPAEATAFLRTFASDPSQMRTLRDVLAGYSTGANPRLDEGVIKALAPLLVSGRVQIIRSFVTSRVRPGEAPVQSAAQTAASVSSAPRNLTWIEFQVVDHVTGQPIPDVALNIRLPSSLEASESTDPAGLVRIEKIEPGTCEAWCTLKDLRMSEALAFVAMGTTGGKGSVTEASKREAMSRRIARIEEHRVTRGETLDGLAKKAGLTWQNLALFNWGTDVPRSINKYLYENVGCTKKTLDGRNYVFDDSDEPGIVYIPSPWKQTALATGTRHVIRVRFIEPFVIVLENEAGLRIPEAEYEATFADGSVRKGKLGRSGIALVKDPPPGHVMLVYPDQDDIVAKSMAASIRQSFDDRNPEEVYRVLGHSPGTIKAVIKAYDTYFNDYTGHGLVEDIYQEITDPSALNAVVGMLARSGIQTHERVQYFTWEDDEED